jgi:hypothetical protein
MFPIYRVRVNIDLGVFDFELDDFLSFLVVFFKMLECQHYVQLYFLWIS